MITLKKEVERTRGRSKKVTESCLSTSGLPDIAMTNLGVNKLPPRYIGPFRVVQAHGDTYTLDIPTTMRLHPTIYVRRLKACRRIFTQTFPLFSVSVRSRNLMSMKLTTTGTKFYPSPSRLVLLGSTKSSSLKLT